MGVAGTNDVSIVFLSKLKLQDRSKYCAVTDRYWDLVRLAIAGRNWLRKWERANDPKIVTEWEGERGWLSARKDVTREMTFPSILDCPLYTLNDLSWKSAETDTFLYCLRSYQIHNEMLWGCDANSKLCNFAIHWSMLYVHRRRQLIGPDLSISLSPTLNSPLPRSSLPPFFPSVHSISFPWTKLRWEQLMVYSFWNIYPVSSFDIVSGNLKVS